MSNQEIAHAVSGAVGGALALGITYPLITLSTIAQTAAKKKQQQDSSGSNSNDKEIKKSSISLTTLQKIHYFLQNNAAYLAAKKIIKDKGILGLYAGLESALYGITLTNFIYYYFYELTSNVFIKANGNKRKGLSTLQSIITGAIAGAFTCVGSNPLWVANTRMMTQQKKAEGDDDKSKSNSNSSSSSSAFKALVEIVENDGFGALFAGVLPALVLVINPIIQYTIFEQIKNAIIANGGTKSFTAIKAFFIGAFGKLIATSLTYPYITLKSRMHIKKKNSKSANGEEQDKQLSMIQEIRKIVREEGFEGLYAGLGVKLTQSIATAAFLFYFKEELFSGSVKLIEVLRALSFRKGLKSPVVKV